jgi:hypothetical protein
MLCQTFTSVKLGQSRFIVWKVRDVPEHIPELKDPGVREQIVAAAKRLEAIPLAKKRAEDLADRARSSDKEFQKALGDETVTGASIGPALAISETGKFSYWQESSVADPMSRDRSVQLGNPAGVDNPGREFMQVVFEQLAEGEIGVAINDDASIYYVVKVLERDSADRDEFKDARLFDPGSAYSSIAMMENRFAQRLHHTRIKEKFQIRVKKISPRAQRSQMADQFDE